MRGCRLVAGRGKEIQACPFMCVYIYTYTHVYVYVLYLCIAVVLFCFLVFPFFLFVSVQELVVLAVAGCAFRACASEVLNCAYHDQHLLGTNLRVCSAYVGPVNHLKVQVNIYTVLMQ